MTTEIVVMNREAVALAADSAATLSVSKIFNTVNKIFMLAPGHSVGIMVYNNARFMTLPWEIIIKLYKDYVIESDVKFSTLEEYGKDFIKFLISNNDSLSTLEQQTHVVGGMVAALFDTITKNIWERFERIIYETSEKLSDEQIIDETKKELNSWLDIFENINNLYEEEDQKDFSKEFFEVFSETIDDVRNEYFDHLQLDEDDIEILNKVCFYQFSKNGRFPFNSGVVFVGYGKDDLLPKFETYIIENLVCNKLKYTYDEEKSGRIAFDGASSRIFAFAQDDIVQTILGGVHPIYVDALKSELKNKFEDEAVKQIFKIVGEEVYNKYTFSIHQAVNSLPKDDLAVMAETLVNLTSFMRKVSMNPETVGGPVDVALISKYDGFVWVKRKQYYTD